MNCDWGFGSNSGKRPYLPGGISLPQWVGETLPGLDFCKRTRQGTFAGQGLFILNYERMVALKQKYDPQNLFQLNPNIQP